MEKKGMNAMFSRVFFHDSITAVLRILSWHGFKAKKNALGYHEINGGHKLHSSTYIFNGKHRFKKGVPHCSMSFVEFNIHADNLQDLQDVTDEHLSPIQSQESVLN